MFHIRTYNKISDKGLSRFSDKYNVGEDISSPNAVLLRSHKLHGEVLPDTVSAIARAGAGTNNIPIEEYTQRGVVVFNTPGANANAVKELVLAGLLLSSRGIMQGQRYVSTLSEMSDAAEMSKLLEKEKKRFAGSELTNKTIGIVGLGAIGSMVANVALSLGMDVVGYDPAISIDAAWRLSSQVRRMESIEALLSCVDYLSLHVPAIPATHHLINQETLNLMKPSAAVLNFARESIVDANAMVAALNQGTIRQYVCDFPEPCLIGHEGVIALPHIGASTAEAEENCAVMAANQLMDYLENGNIVNSVNFPHTSMPRGNAGCRITFTNANVSGVLGHVLSVFAENKVNVVDMVNKSRNEVAYNILDLADKPSDDVIECIKNVEHVISLRVLC
ncbi:3-phosphoglycerate dehydrogenase family protein [Agarilytica rhodophyticola]|uniref:3-phosphoglycerate dehydrogenase family protein n=1 Tax=Agarilytica rhodophyticola TaxID=1737490 RepID=UPI000B349B66|nr:3-phosphoglycerate dehydrogenase family protein [Agarilytica rhodophyticola]